MMASVFPELTHAVFPRRPAWLGGKATAVLTDPMRHLLVLRFALFNLVTFGFLAVASVGSPVVPTAVINCRRGFGETTRE